MKCLIVILFLLLLTVANAQINNTLTQGPFAALPWTTIERNDYSLQCPTGWQIDSSSSELKIVPRGISQDSLMVYVASFNMKIVPFNAYIKNPPVDYDAKTNITVNRNSTIYKVSSKQKCYNCSIPMHREKEQYYCTANNKVYVVYFMATGVMAEKYKNAGEIVLNSFKLKNN